MIPRPRPSSTTQAPLQIPGASPNAPTEAFGGGAAATNIDLRDVQQVAERIWERQRNKADTAAILAGDNAIWEIEKELFYDPEKGAFSRRGQDALTAYEEAMSAYTERVSEVQSGLTTPRQREAFAQRVASRRQSLEGRAENYVAGEVQKYVDAETQSALDAITERAALSFDNPTALNDLLNDSRGIVLTYGQQNGINGKVLERKMLVETSRFHSVVLSRMLAQGQDLTAVDYLKNNRAEMTAADSTELERQIGKTNIDNEALRVTAAIWTTQGPKTTNDAINTSDMEDAVRERFEGRPELIRAAISDLRVRAEAFREQTRQLTATNASAILGRFNNGENRLVLIRSPEYLTLNGTDQERLNSYMLDRLTSLTDRAKKDRENSGFQAYWRYSRPEELSKMSEEQVLALEPELGQELTAALMRQKRAVVDVRAASIDADQFNFLVREAGFDPTEKKQAVELGALKYHVENAIERAQQAAGRNLNREEKKVLMQEIVNNKVWVDRWGFDPNKPLATLSIDEVGNAYLPMAELQQRDAAFVTQGLAWMRTEGLLYAHINDANALQTVAGRRLERAYVARLRGASTAETQAILRGNE
jgi:hypothetical protein